ncbi:MAG: ABC transporter ATP-binding protein [Vulcanimicrobiota bacterium]
MKSCKVKVENLTKIYYQHNSLWGKVRENLNLPFNRKKVKEICVLRGLNLEIADGERLGIIGRNGAGKSTLLRIVAGLMKPTEGTVHVRGELTALFDTATGFHPDFTGRQNVLTNLGYRGVTGKEARKIVEEVIEFSELYDFIDQPFKTYSSGMQSRLTFSAATAINPDILIIDEVLGAGDAYFASKCLERMKEITFNGATVILVSHSMGAVAQFSNRAIWIDRGCILADGRPMDVINTYQKSVETYERLRMIAKNAKLQIKLSPSILSGTFGRYLLFRLTTKEADSSSVSIHQIRLLNGKEDVHRLMVGGPMDNDAGYSIFLSGEPKNTGWSKPQTMEGRLCRNITGTNSDNACFLCLFPLEPSENDDYSLTFDILASSAVKVTLDIMNTESKFLTIEEMDIDQNGWSTYHCRIPREFYRIGVEFHASEDVFSTFSGSFKNEIAVKSGEHPAEQAALSGEDFMSGLSSEGIREKVRQRFPDDEGPVFITSFYMYRNDIRETSFEMGDSFFGEIEYISIEDVEEPIFVFNITRIDGVRMRQSLSSTDGLSIDCLNAGKGRVRFMLSPLIFGPGDYMVSVAVTSHVDLTNTVTVTKTMSLRSNSYEFKVLSQKNVLADMGCVHCPVTWEVRE